MVQATSNTERAERPALRKLLRKRQREWWLRERANRE
jgi:hypothetical protein